MGGNFNNSIAPEIYYSGTLSYHSFTFLYSHNQHAYVTFIKVFVKMRLFQTLKIIYLCNRCTFVWQEQTSHIAHSHTSHIFRRKYLKQKSVSMFKIDDCVKIFEISMYISVKSVELYVQNMLYVCMLDVD